MRRVCSCVIGETDGSTASKQTRVVAAAVGLSINKLKELDCQNDTGGSIEPQMLFGVLSNQIREHMT